MMELLTQLPLSIKAGWLVLAVWSVAQLLSYHHVRIMPSPPPPRRVDSSRRRSAERKPAVATALPTGGSPEFLAELGLHNADNTPTTTDSVYR